MKVKDLISLLKEDYDKDEEIYVAWWAREHFTGTYKARVLTKQRWDEVVHRLENNNLDSETYAIMEVIDEVLS